MNKNKILEEIKIGKMMKSSEYMKEPGRQVEVNGIKFFSPLSCLNTYILGLGEAEYKVEVGDDRYEQIKAWIQENVMPYLDVHGKHLCSSYGLKHLIEDNIGGYVSNETVKVIMCELGAKKRRFIHGHEYPINLFYSYNGVMGVERYKNENIF